MLLPSPPCCAQHCGTPLLSGSAAPAPRPSLLGHARQTQGPNDTGHLSHRELSQAPGLAQEGVGKGLRRSMEEKQVLRVGTGRVLNPSRRKGCCEGRL